MILSRKLFSSTRILGIKHFTGNVSQFSQGWNKTIYLRDKFIHYIQRIPRV